MITQENYISISDLRDKTAQVVKDLGKSGKKIVLSQNKPVWVFLSVEEYNAMTKLNFAKEYATQEDVKAYQKSSHGADAVEAFSFLETLK